MDAIKNLLLFIGRDNKGLIMKDKSIFYCRDIKEGMVWVQHLWDVCDLF